MKVVHIIVGLHFGGAELMLKRLVTHPPGASGRRHAVISLTDMGKVGEELRSLGIDVQMLGMSSMLDAPRALWRLMTLLRASQPDIVQTWMYHADLIGGLAARLAGCRAVVWGIRTTHLPEGGSRATRWIRWLCARLSGWVPQTIICAAEASRTLHAELGYARERMVVIPNGYDFQSLVADPSARSRLRPAWGIPGQGLVVGYVGRFSPDKDPETFVRAAAQVAGAAPEARFLMVGRGQDEANAALGAWIAATGVPERFILLGERSDVPDLLSAMDVFCLSSRTEGFPNGVAEAMALGLPCVVTDAGDAAFLVGEAGRIVPIANSEALAQSVLEVMALGVEGRAELGAKGRARVNSEFTIQRACERFEAVYEAVLEKGRR